MPDDDNRKPRLDLSPSQLLGGSLAAATAAALGSRLGVVGTILGAALFSVVSAVTAAVYTISLRRTRELVKARERLTMPAPSLRRRPASPPVVDAALRDAMPPEGSARNPGWWKQMDWSRLKELNWRRVGAAAAAVFVTTVLVVTGMELLSGHSFSGRPGTTVGNSWSDPQPTPSAPTPSTSKPTKSSATTPSPAAPRTTGPPPGVTTRSQPTPGSGSTASTPTAAAPSSTPTPAATPTASPSP